MRSLKTSGGSVFWNFCRAESKTSKYNIYRQTSVPDVRWHHPVFSDSIVFFDKIVVKGCNGYITMENNVMSAKEGYILRLNGATFYEIVVFKLPPK